MDCGIPFCHNGCPLGNLIPEWNDLAWRGDWREAIERLHATNNFPEFTGRLCPAPCETACVLGINSTPVTIKQVEVDDHRPGLRRGLGHPAAAGPALRQDRRRRRVRPGRAGRRPAAHPRRSHRRRLRAGRPLGGLLRYGIPEFKMEKRHLDRRLAQMEAEGTRFRTGVDVGGDVDRRRSCAAATTPWSSPSAPPSRATCRCPGASSTASCRRWTTCRTPTGRHSAATSTRARSPPTGKHVVIIGGGDTGADCLGTAHRQGAARSPSWRSCRGPPTSARTPTRGRPTR